jgi:hypothetical protein
VDRELLQHGARVRIIGVDPIAEVGIRDQAEAAQPMQDLGEKVPPLAVETRRRQDVPIRSELCCGIEADGLRIDVADEALDAGEVEVADACSDGLSPPDRGCSGRIGQVCRCPRH